MNQFECCISDDKHFCNEPILLKNNCNVCKKCITELDCNEIWCNNCGNFHDIRELRKSIENFNVNLLRSMEQENLNKLFQVLKERFCLTIKNIEGFLCADYFENNINFIESEVYIRIESLKIQLDEFGENFREKLKKIKDTFNDLVSNESIRNIPVDLQNLHDNFKIDLDNFYVYQDKLRMCKKQIDDLKIHIPKIRFDWNNVNLEESIIGKLTHNYCDYTQIKSLKSYELPGFLWFARMKLINNNNNILITDRRNKTIILTDLNGNLMKNYQEQNLFAEPFAICVNKRNEIFIGDYIDKNIFVFDENFNLLRKFGNETLIESSSFAIDDYEDNAAVNSENEMISDKISLLFVTSKFMNTVTVWNSDTGEFVKKFKINKPEYIQISDKKLFIVGRVNNSNIYTLSQHLSDANKNIIYSANCIYIVNKITFDMIHTIQLDNCYDLKGLFVDNNLNIFTFGKEYRYDDTNYNENERVFNNFLTTKSRYLYVFNERTGYCSQRTLIDGLHDLSDFIVIRNKLIICYRDTIKIIEFIFNV